MCFLFFFFPLPHICLNTRATTLVYWEVHPINAVIGVHIGVALYAFFSCFALICCIWLYQLSCPVNVRVRTPPDIGTGALIDVVLHSQFWDLLVLLLRLRQIWEKPDSIGCGESCAFDESLSYDVFTTISRQNHNVPNWIDKWWIVVPTSINKCRWLRARMKIFRLRFYWASPCKN